MIFNILALVITSAQAQQVTVESTEAENVYDADCGQWISSTALPESQRCLDAYDLEGQIDQVRVKYDALVKRVNRHKDDIEDLKEFDEAMQQRVADDRLAIDRLAESHGRLLESQGMVDGRVDDLEQEVDTISDKVQQIYGLHVELGSAVSSNEKNISQMRKIMDDDQRCRPAAALLSSVYARGKIDDVNGEILPGFGARAAIDCDKRMAGVLLGFGGVKYLSEGWSANVQFAPYIHGLDRDLGFGPRVTAQFTHFDGASAGTVGQLMLGIEARITPVRSVDQHGDVHFGDILLGCDAVVAQSEFSGRSSRDAEIFCSLGAQMRY